MAQNQQSLRAFLFSVEVTLDKINLSITFPCKLQIQWKRGNQKLESASTPNLEKGIADFNKEKLTIQSNMYFDEQKKLFVEKKSTFTILLITSKGNKVAGTYALELSNYLNQNKNKNSFEETLKLDKCPDKNAVLKIKLDLILIKEIDIETISQMSTISKALNDSFEEKPFEQKQLVQVNQENSDEKLKSPTKVVQQVQNQKTEEKQQKLVEDLQRQNQLKVEEINRYMNQIQDLRMEKDSFKEQIQETINEQQQQISQKTQELIIQSLNKDNVVKQLQIVESENVNFQNSFKSAQDILIQKDQKIHTLQNEIDEKCNIIQKVEKEKILLEQQNKISDSSMEKDSFKEQIQETINELQQQISQKTKELIIQSLNNDNVVKQLQIVESENINFQNSFKSAQDILIQKDQKIHTLQNEIDEKYNIIQKVEKEKILLEQQNKISDSSMEKDSFKEQIQETINELQQQISQKTQELIIQSLNNDNVVKQLQIVESENINFQNSFKSAQDKLIKKDLMIHSLQNDIDEQCKLIQQVEKERILLKQQYYESLDKLQIKDEVNQQGSDRLGILNSTLEQEKQNYNMLKIEFEDIQQNSSNILVIKKKLEQENNQLQQKYDSLQQINKQLVEEIENALETIQQLQGQISVSSQQEQSVQQLNDQIKNLNGQLNFKEQEYNMIYIQNQNLESQKEQLTESLQSIKLQKNTYGEQIQNQNLLELQDLLKLKEKNQNLQLSEIETLKQENEFLTNSLQIIKIEVEKQAKSQKEIISLKEKIVQLNILDQKLQEDLNLINTENKSLKQEIDTHKESLKHKEQMIKSQDSIDGSMVPKLDVTIYSEEIAQLKIQLSSQNQIKSQESSIQLQYNLQLQDLQDQLDHQQQKFQQQQNQNQTLDKKVEMLNDQLLEKEEKSITQSEQNKLFQQQQIKMQNKYDKMNEELSQLKVTNQETLLQFKQASESLIKVKCQLGDLLNAAQEFGGSKLADKLFMSLGHE